MNTSRMASEAGKPVDELFHPIARFTVFETTGSSPDVQTTS